MGVEEEKSPAEEEDKNQAEEVDKNPAAQVCSLGFPAPAPVLLAQVCYVIHS
jgi:hypothetical protein